jgi:hypothetical protein
VNVPRWPSNKLSAAVVRNVAKQVLHGRRRGPLPSGDARAQRRPLEKLDSQVDLGRQGAQVRSRLRVRDGPRRRCSAPPGPRSTGCPGVDHPAVQKRRVDEAAPRAPRSPLPRERQRSWNCCGRPGETTMSSRPTGQLYSTRAHHHVHHVRAHPVHGKCPPLANSATCTAKPER